MVKTEDEFQKEVAEFVKKVFGGDLDRAAEIVLALEDVQLPRAEFRNGLPIVTGEGKTFTYFKIEGRFIK